MKVFTNELVMSDVPWFSVDEGIKRLRKMKRLHDFPSETESSTIGQSMSSHTLH